VLLAALARGGGRRLARTAVAVVVLAYIPYLTVGAAVLGSLGQLLGEERFNGSLQPLLSRLAGGTAAAALLGLGVAALVAVVATREHQGVEEVARSAVLVLGALILVSSYVQPWYALALLPMLCLTAAPGWLWLTGALPLAYLNGIDGTLPSWVQPAVYGPLFLLAAGTAWRARRPGTVQPAPLAPPPRVAAVIPALDEEHGVRALLAEWPAGVVDEVVVVDGGSSDGTRRAAIEGGARVVVEARRGYGRACSAGAAATAADVVVFLDGDGSTDPADLAAVLEPVLAGRAHLCLGARRPEAGAVLPHQALGNRLVALLIRAVHGVRVRDVPPMRAVRRDALAALGMREMTYGWPTEMIVKAARRGLVIEEVEVAFHRRRSGASKVSGRLWPSLRAGALMLAVTLRGAAPGRAGADPAAG
jgi:CTP:molybdopterin cytidylyltransferase MocA